MDTSAADREDPSFRPNAYLSLLGIRRLIPTDGDSQAELVITDKLKNPSGVTHGGAIFSLLDGCMSGVLRKHLSPGESASTIECKINYLKGVRDGKLLCTARLVKRGSQVSVIEAEVIDQDNALVAKGLATFMVVKPRAR